MHKQWSKWLEYAEKIENGQSINLAKQRDAAHIFIQQHQHFLQHLSDDFILSKSMLKKKETQNANMQHAEEKKRDSHIKPEDALYNIQHRHSMQAWIAKYKLEYDLISSAFGCCRKNYNYSQDAGQTELDITTPMHTWKWQNVVAFVETCEELRHLASVFWQYRISGAELCKMGSKQIELLIECSMLNNNNFIEADFDRLKSAHTAQHRWELSADAANFVYFKDKTRIQSHIISQYHLSIDVLHEIIDGVLDSEQHIFQQFYQDCAIIADVVRFLRANLMDGSKEYWKMDVYFFNKIDNYLAVLISDDLLREMYQKCYFDFLVSPGKARNDYVQQLMAENSNNKKEDKSILLPEQESKMKAKNSIKAITSQLNLLGSKEKHIAVQSGCGETCAERLCCSFVVSSLDTIYIPLLCLTVIPLLCCALFIIIWFYWHGLSQQTDYIHLTIDPMGERARHSIIDEFWVPQMIISMAIGALFSGDLHINASQTVGNYDDFLVSFSNIPYTESVFSLGLYNGDDNSLLIAYRGNSSMDIWNFNGSCSKAYGYGASIEYINNLQADCNNYDVTSRAWHTLAMENKNKAIWTEPYLFSEGYFGMSLVAAVEFYGTLVIFLCEIRVDSLSDTVLSKDIVIPTGTVIMIATPKLDIIASTTHDIYLQDGEQTNEGIVVSTAKYIKQLGINGEFQESFTHFDAEKGYSVSIFSFEMVYVNMIPSMDTEGNDLRLIQPLTLNNSDDYQYGYIVIANDDKYLFNIDLAFVISWIALGFVLIGAVTLICINMKYHNDSVGRRELTENQVREHWLSTKAKAKQPHLQTIELMAKPKKQIGDAVTVNALSDVNQIERDEIEDNVRQIEVEHKCQCCYLTQQQIIIASFCQILALCLFLIGLWIGLLSGAKSDLIQNIMAKQEWGAAKDEVMELYKTADMLFAIYFNRYKRGDFGANINTERNRLFLANVMQSFVGNHNHPLYFMHSTYLAAANGELFGVGWHNNATAHQLSQRIRNIDTDFELKEYVLSDNVSIVYDEEILDLHLYDPRCEAWYKNAMKYAFNGTLDQAFPANNSFAQFIGDELAAAATEACHESRILFADMFDVELSEHSTDIISAYNNYINNSYIYDTTNDTVNGMPYKLVWTRHLFFSLNEIGLTASAAIQDPVTGNLFAVLGIDFSLAQLSSLLHETTANAKITADNHWFAWIFDADINKPEMIASSEFNIYANYDDEAFAQCSDVDTNSKIAYYATSHPNDEIRIASNEINVTGIHSLEKNANESTSIGIPINFPLLEAGRISYWPQGEASIDWVVAKTVSDITDSTVDSIQVTLYVTFTMLAMTMFLMKEINFKDEYDELDEEGLDKKEDANYYYKLMLKMEAIVSGAAISAWQELVHDNDQQLLQKDESEIKMNIITTKQAKQFMANRANQHIAWENENELKFTECAWEASILSQFGRSRNKKFRIAAFRFIESNLYGILNQFFLCLHLTTSLFEPSTPLELRNNGLSNTVLTIIAFCILMEWLDVFLIIYRRYIEFSIAEPFLTQLYEINYGAAHKYTKLVKKYRKYNRLMRRLYLVFVGPKWQIFLVHCALNVLILLNFLTRACYRIGYLSYYLPVLPFLLLIRNETILKFSSDFLFAVNYAKDVLLSYISFILIFAILSQSLFKTAVNASEFSESFETMTQALITAFVYISTSENYTFMYDVFDANYYMKHANGLLINATFLSLSFAMIGLFIFVPLIIHRFELAFEERTILQNQQNIVSKENAIVAAFILLDMNGDLDIDQQEFHSLVNSSILVDKNKLFDAFDDNKSGGININEFVQHLLKQTFRSKVRSERMPKQNKLRAYLECNVARHPLYKTCILCGLVIPFIMISLLKGVETNFSETYLNYALYAFFLLNMLEIHFVVFIYGIERYFDLQKYANPDYISAAINKYESISEIVRLTSSERSWVKNNLSSIRPLSILEKSTLTLIHRLQFVVIWLTFCAFLFCRIYFFIYYSKIDSSNFIQMNQRYALYFIQFGVLFRLFFLIPSNQKLTYVIFSVFPQFLSLFAFLALFMYGYARVGCTIFGDNVTAVVTPGVYDQASAIKTNFNNLSYAMLALLQLMVGEGWHEIMYYNVIATHPMAALYFIAYITAVTIIISNVFVGLFLADIDQLSTQQTNDDILVNSHKTQSFEKYANYSLNLLQYKIKMEEIKKEKMQKQVDKIQLLLFQHKLKLVQNQNIKNKLI